MAQFPSARIAELSYDFRTLGLGYANLGALLMTMGHGYDSAEGRALCGALTAIMTGAAYAASAEMARELGAFPGYARERRAHAAGDPQPPPRRRGAPRPATRGSRVPPVALDHANCPDRGAAQPRARRSGTRRSTSAQAHGFRNAQATVIAPTGTIGLVMDCDTTGIEPDFALVKFKKLAGGGYFKIINQLGAAGAARTSATAEAEIAEIVAYAVGHGTLDGAPQINPTALVGHGFGADEIAKVEAALPGGLRHPLRLQPLDARRGVLHRTCSASRPRSCATRPSTCCATSASPGRRSTRRTPTSAAR